MDPKVRTQIYFWCKIHKIKLIIWKWDSLAFHTFTMLCHHQHYLVSEHFITPKGDLVPTEQSLHTILLLSSWQPLIYSLSLWVYLFLILHIKEILQYVTFNVWLL
jgi:hypothetical protein